jgi:hypothetical protein
MDPITSVFADPITSVFADPITSVFADPITSVFADENIMEKIIESLNMSEINTMQMTNKIVYMICQNIKRNRKIRIRKELNYIKSSIHPICVNLAFPFGIQYNLEEIFNANKELYSAIDRIYTLDNTYFNNHSFNEIYQQMAVLNCLNTDEIKNRYKATLNKVKGYMVLKTPDIYVNDMLKRFADLKQISGCYGMCRSELLDHFR